MAYQSYHRFDRVLQNGFDEVTSWDLYFSWQKNVLTTLYTNEQIAESMFSDTSYEIEEGLMQSAGMASISNPSHINLLNTGVFQFAIGPICYNAVRPKAITCGRKINDGYSRTELCSK